MDPRLFNEWAQMIAVPSDADPVVADRVRAAIDTLTARQRDVINGLFYEHLTKTVLANRLGLSRHEVRKVMLDAIEGLREALAKGRS